ncbi:MAG: flagellar motor protein MotB [Luteitalea sp.]
MANHAPVIIIKKKRASHAGHHGGAWKVAYAEFVTAMMAFFLVMWLVNQSQEVKESVAAYFTDPGIFEHQKGNAPIAGGNGALNGMRPPPPDVVSATASLERAAARIKGQLRMLPGFRNLEDQIDVQVTAEGLRIELQESGQDTFFDSGSSHLKRETEQVLQVIARELAALAQPVAIEGHTDAAPFGTGRGYTNWELSADRANAARRVMEGAGLEPTQIKAIRGFAATILRTPAEPYNPRNRRVSIVVQQAGVGSPVVTGRAGKAPAAAAH